MPIKLVITYPEDLNPVEEEALKKHEELLLKSLVGATMSTREKYEWQRNAAVKTQTWFKLVGEWAGNKTEVCEWPLYELQAKSTEDLICDINFALRKKDTPSTSAPEPD